MKDFGGDRETVVNVPRQNDVKNTEVLVNLFIYPRNPVG